MYRACMRHTYADEYIVFFSSESAPSSVHPEHRELDEHNRPAREREVREVARPQPPLRQREHEDVVLHARPDRVRHERGEPEGGARQRLHERVRRRAHDERDASSMGEVQDGRRGAGCGSELRREVAMRGDEREPGGGGELGERADGDAGEGDEKEEEGVDHCK
jgi:hypothetical protein